MSNTLDWVTIRDARPINTVGGYLTIPAFSYSNQVWTGASAIVVQFGYSTSRNCIIPRSPRKPTGCSYILCVRYRQGNRVTRYAFWTDDNAVLPNVPFYDGELLPRNIVFEVWSINGQTEVSNTEETVIGLSLRRIVTDFSVTPTAFEDSAATIIPATTISAPLALAPDQPLTDLAFDNDPAQILASPVATWPDTSGNGRDIVQAVAANRPTLTQVNPGAGNFSCVNFDGVDDFMTGPVVASDATLYFVMKQVAWTALMSMFSFIANNSRRIRQAAASPELSYYSGAGSVFSTDKLQVDTWGIVTIQLSTAGPNSIRIGSFDAATDDVTVGQLSKLSIGAEHTGLNFSMIQVLRLLGYSAVQTEAQQLAVRQYLAATYFGGGPLPLVFGANNQWLDNPGFPVLVPNATPPDPDPTPNVTPPDTNIGSVLGNPETGDVFGNPDTGEAFGAPS